MNPAATPYVVAIVLGAFVGMLTRVTRMDRDRALYPVALIVIAWYYILFAVMGGPSALGAEVVAMVAFSAIAIVGFTANLWWAVAGIAGHGVFDFVRDRFITNPGVPAFWPAFCGTIDVVLAAWLAALLLLGRIPATPRATSPQRDR